MSESTPTVRSESAAAPTDALPAAQAAAPSTVPATGSGGESIDAEIFSTGLWNGERFTRRDLHEIARNFRRLQRQLQPPLKFGHDEGQTLLGQRDGDPALGWVEQLWVRGDRLLARFAGMPRVVLEAIRAGRYRRVSAELYFNVRQGGKRLGKALKAVALLGADLPAVTNLNDLTAYLASTVPARAPALAAAPARVFSVPVQGGRIDIPTSEETSMSEPETGPELQAELAELRAYRERQEARHSEERQRRQSEAFRSTRESAAAFCAAQVSAGRLSPHLHERLLRELDAQARTFAEGQPLRVSFDWLRRFIEATPAALPVGELAHAAGAGAAEPGDGNPSAILARLAANAMAELNLSYGEASAYVLRTQPELARTYRDFTLHPSK